jgi:hypothetical protein
MSRTAETYIDKPRKFAHDAFAVMAGTAFIAAFTGFMTGKPGLAVIGSIAGLALAHISSKIKYTWMKQVEVGGYKLV